MKFDLFGGSTELVVAGAIALAVFGTIAGQYLDIKRLEATLFKEQATSAKERGDAATALAAATTSYRATETRLNAANQKASDDYADTLKKRDLIISGLRTERMRLRADITRYVTASRQTAPDSATGQCAADPRVATLGALLSRGIDVEGRGEEVARALTDQVTGLQTYINNVCQQRSNP